MLPRLASERDRRFLIGILIATCLASGNASGQDQTDSAAATGQVAVGEIERQPGELTESEVASAILLDDLRRSALDTGVEVISLQRDVQIIQERIDTLRVDESASLAVLDSQRERLNRLAAGLQRLSRTPLEVWAIADGPSAELIRGSLLLNQAMEPVEQEAEAIGQTIATLSDTRALLSRERAERGAVMSVREERMSELNRLIGDRQAALEQLVEDSAPLTERLSILALQADSLGDLISAIDSDPRLLALEARVAAERTAIAEAALSAGVGSIEDYASEISRDHILLPTSGVVETEFGAAGADGEPAQRLTMTVEPATLVVAPLAAVVRYSGPFQDDGLILILDHGGGYHSIIANVGRLDAMAGQAVVAGEPVAVTALPQSETTPTSSLFFEVRRNGSPVNPLTELVLAQGRGPQ
ncbi:MAG: peptidoglycan DD-metalloendopeptidase family protein [Pseudomonadota bacterium]